MMAWLIHESLKNDRSIFASFLCPGDQSRSCRTLPPNPTARLTLPISMKIRTITTGFNLTIPLQKEQIATIARFANKAKTAFEKRGYIVQTIRIATQPWEDYFHSKAQIVSLVKTLEELIGEYNIDYFSVGTTTNPRIIPVMHDMIQATSTMFCAAQISDDKHIDYEAARQTAKVIKKNSTISEDGFHNLRFAALCNTKPGSPFFPAAYHEGPTSFAIGTENSDLVYKAFSEAKTIEKAKESLTKVLTSNAKEIERIATQLSQRERVNYGGIDVSIAPSVEPEESIAFAFEKLGLGEFGDVGTLAVARIITETLEKLNVMQCGYSGLMLPVLEDYGLAKRNAEGKYNVTDLLLYSAVCGTGLDTIPLAGDVDEKKIFALLLDIASLSVKLNKPLSARLMPIPNKKRGEMTAFEFEYFANSKTMKI